MLRNPCVSGNIPRQSHRAVLHEPLKEVGGVDEATRSCVQPPFGEPPSITFERHFYKAGHAIENLFAKLKQHRSPATRHDKIWRIVSTIIAIAWVLPASDLEITPKF
jgi:transposase